MFTVPDVNDDNAVDFSDLLETLNIIFDDRYDDSADVDVDGDVDYNDIVKILNLLLQ